MKAFKLRQFALYHHRSAQRIGTDSLLLGAWAKQAPARRILDVGSGCGLLAFMLAQRYPQARVAGVEIDFASHQEALANRAANPAFGRLQFYHQAFQDFPASGQKWDLLVSNPPYFDHAYPRQEARTPERHLARHQTGLKLEALFLHARKRLAERGSLQLILPLDQHRRLAAILPGQGWQLHRSRSVLPREGRPAHRMLSAWTVAPQALSPVYEKALPIRDEQGEYSETYQALTRDFHPWI